MSDYSLVISTIFTKKKDDGSTERSTQEHSFSTVKQDYLFNLVCNLQDVSAHPEILSSKNETIEIQLGVLVDVVADKYSTFDVKCECCVTITELESDKKPLEFYSSGYKKLIY